MAPHWLFPEAPDSFTVRTLRAFFDEDRVRKLLLPLLLQTSQISLRAIDWLCVNLSKQTNIVCADPKGHLWNIHQEYKIALKVYQRPLFDPFRRGRRCSVHLDGKVYETTLGQCNFVAWAWTKGMLQFAEANREAIEHAMNEFTVTHRSRLRQMRQSGQKRRRSALSRSASSLCRIYAAPAVVSF